MSRKIDSRVVEMQFDNKQFESNVKTSMFTLDKLKRSLNLTGASKGLENIGTAAKNVNMSGLSGAVEAVSLKFSALQVIAVTALANITTSVMRTTGSLLKNVIRTITEGGKKRALNIEQAKFQFKGLGMDVEATMADASYAVDGTAYSLDAAAKVASQLGASGMRAGDDMRKSLRAVSGVAAMAGSSYEDIGNVFTKVAGQGRLMGDDLLRLSSRGINAAATIAKELNKTEAEVRDMVTKGKVDFQTFADAMDAAFGEHATAANETFTGSLANVNAALARIGENIYGPLHENMIGPLNELRLKINEVAKILEPMFAKLAILMEKAGKKATEMLKNLDLTEMINKIKMGDKTSDKLRRTFAGLFAVLDLVGQVMGFVLKVAGNLFGLFGGPAAGGILGVTASIGDLLVKLNEAVKKSDIFNKSFDGLKNTLTIIADKIKDAVTRIKEAFGGFKSIDTGPLDEFSERSEKSLRPFTSLGKIFGAAFEAIVKVLEWAAPIVAKLGSIIGNGLEALADKVSYAVDNMEFNEILDLINTGLFGAILYGIKKFIDSLTEITSGAGGFLDGITGILDGVRGSLEAYQSSLKAKTLLTIATAIGILAAALMVLSLINSDKLTISLAAITVLFVELSIAMFALNKSLVGIEKAKISVQLVAMATAILILSHAMKNLAELDWAGLAKGTLGIAALAATLVVSANMLDKSSGKIIKGSIGLIAFSEAILILTHAVDNLAQLSWGELAKGLVGLTIILTEVVALTHLMGDPKRIISTGIGMIALGTAMVIFASAVEKMGQLSWGEIARGLVAMAGALTAVTVALNFMPKGMITKAAGMVVIGAALLIIADAMAKFGNMQWNEIARGLVAMAGALTAVTVALNFMPKGMITKALGLIGIATALQIMIEPLKQMAGMSWGEIAKGLVTLGGSLLIITVAMNAMTGGLAGAAAMLVIAAAIRMFTPALVSLGRMDLAEIGKALLALVGVFGVVGAAGLLLAPVIPAILGLAAAIALLGVAVLAIGAGLLAFSAGLTALAVAGTSGAAALVVIVTSLISLIPMVLEKIGEGIIAFAGVIINGLPMIMEAVKQIALALIQILGEITLPVVEALLTFLVTLLEQLANAVPQMIDAGMRLLLAILEGISAHIMDIVVVAMDIISEFLRCIAEGIPGIIQAGIDIVISLIDGLAQGIEENAPRIRDAFIHLFESLLKAVLVFLGINSPSKKFTDIGMNIIQGLINGIGNMLSDAIKAIVNVVTDLVSAIANKMGKFSTKGKELMINFKNGISNKLSDVKNAAIKIVSNVLSGIGGKLSEFTSMGSKLINGLKRGIQDAAGSVVSAARGVVSDAISAAKNLLGIHSPSKVFADIGKYSGEGFIQGLKSYSSKVVDASKDVGKGAIDGISSAISGIADVLNSDMDMEPTIRPVLDLSDVERGTSRLNALFSRTQAMGKAGGLDGHTETNTTNDNRTINISVDAGNIEELQNVIEIFTGLKQKVRMG